MSGKEDEVDLEKTCDEEKKVEDPNEVDTDKVEDPKVGMEFNSVDDIYEYYSKYARQNGFAVFKRNLKRGPNGNLKYAAFACIRSGKPRIRTSNPVKLRPQTKLGCKAAVNAVLCFNGSWMLSSFELKHNHEMSPSKSRFFKSNRILNQYVKRRLEINDMTGIRMNKNFGSLLSELGGEHEKLPFLEKDCRNYIEKFRRLRLGEGDASAMLSYFQKCKLIIVTFFYSIDVDEEGRLRNVFWADARSKAAFKEFGDVVTFDTTYLVNRYDMPFAPFVGVNHHGQSTLLGCALITNENTETFKWLFKCWLTCMFGCAPPAIITDQDKAMKKAIEIVFPNTRHRWCIWHILKKIPEKLGGYKEYEDMSIDMLEVVYDSLSEEDFEKNWRHFIEMYKLEGNEWLLGLYDERQRWVPTFVKDTFWAGMSSTQRSESMHSFFDGYINSKTTLKQFMEQYENALAKKVEKEKEADFNSSNSYIPCFTKYELERQFHSSYTLAKFKEVRDQLVGMIYCNLNISMEGDGFSEYEVREDVLYGQKKKRLIFKVCFKENGSEVNCNCRLFESRGILCKHCIMILLEKGIYHVPKMYILKRWSKIVKRCHTKVRISYDKSSTNLEARRYDHMCNEFFELADLAQDYQERYEKVLEIVCRLKGEFKEVEVGCKISGSISGENGGREICKEITNVVDPLVKKRKGRPPSKRKKATRLKKGGGRNKKIASAEETLEEETDVRDEYIGCVGLPTQDDLHPNDYLPNNLNKSMQ